MKLAIKIPLVLLAIACGVSTVIASAGSEMLPELPVVETGAPSADPEEVLEPETLPTEPETEPTEPEPTEPDASEFVTIHVADDQGNPIPYLSGNLTHTHMVGDQEVNDSYFLASMDNRLPYTDEMGNLYLRMDEGLQQSFGEEAIGFRVKLMAVYDGNLSQEEKIELPESIPGTVEIVWTQGAVPGPEAAVAVPGADEAPPSDESSGTGGESSGNSTESGGESSDGGTESSGSEAESSSGAESSASEAESSSGAESSASEAESSSSGVAPAAAAAGRAITLVIADPNGNPVSGVTLKCADPDLTLGPSGADGSIVWTPPEGKRTYLFAASKVGNPNGEQFALEYPGDGSPIQTTFSWTHG